MADQNGKRQVGDKVTGTVLETDRLIGIIGTGVHTGLRKGSDAPSAHGLWTAISRSQDGAWSDAAEYCLWSLRYMGYEIVKVD